MPVKASDEAVAGLSLDEGFEEEELLEACRRSRFRWTVWWRRRSVDRPAKNANVIFWGGGTAWVSWNR